MSYVLCTNKKGHRTAWSPLRLDTPPSLACKVCSLRTRGSGYIILTLLWKHPGNHVRTAWNITMFMKWTTLSLSFPSGEARSPQRSSYKWVSVSCPFPQMLAAWASPVPNTRFGGAELWLPPCQSYKDNFLNQQDIFFLQIYNGKCLVFSPK